MKKISIIILLTLLFSGCNSGDNSKTVSTGVSSSNDKKEMSAIEQGQLADNTAQNTKTANKEEKKAARKAKRQAEKEERKRLMSSMSKEEKEAYLMKLTAYREEMKQWRQTRKVARLEAKQSGDKSRLDEINQQKPVFSPQIPE